METPRGVKKKAFVAYLFTTLIVALPSRMARGTALRSPLASMTSAVSMATSIPVPMAIPTSAYARAGASLIPSPTIATLSSAPCNSFYLLRFFLWPHPSHDVIYFHLLGETNLGFYCTEENDTRNLVEIEATRKPLFLWI